MEEHFLNHIKPTKIMRTCTNIRCPERKSLCCGAEVERFENTDTKTPTTQPTTITHHQYCNIAVAERGQWSASIEPYCTCEQYTPKTDEEIKVQSVIRSGKTIAGLQWFYEHGTNGESVILKTPNGNFYSPKAAEEALSKARAEADRKARVKERERIEKELRPLRTTDKRKYDVVLWRDVLISLTNKE